jgi:hypothetical protein
MSAKRPAAETFGKRRIKKHRRTKSPRTRPDGYQPRKRTGT